MTDHSRHIPFERYAARLTAARYALADRGLGAMLIGVGPDLRYLTGFVGEPMERVTILIVPRQGPVSFVVPRLEAQKARTTPLVAGGHAEVVPFEETEDGAAIVARLLATAGAGADFGRPIGVSDRLWAMHVFQMQAALPGSSFVPASVAMRDLRQVKDADEQRLLGLAAAAADRTVDRVAAGLLVGRTEADVSREIRGRLIDEGHDLADFAIVGSGPNSASPHHEASDRLIQAGEPIVLDIGGTLDGYGSDTTRTIWVDGGDPALGPDPEFRRLFAVLREAQAAATASVAPGVTCQDVDASARRIITDGGYGPQFFHRTGHGIGLEAHEDPYLVAGNAEPLRAGYAFSVEPGIYLEGRYGSRLEDIVVCGPVGPLVLNRSPLDLQVVDGR